MKAIPFRYHFLTLLILLPGFLIAGSSFKDSSVLSTGRWYKLAVIQTGIHRITYEDLVNMGLNPSQLNPANLRLYGNGSGMLPEMNSIPRVDDLRENSILVRDGGDGRFDPADDILFYGEAPDRWFLDTLTRQFYHSKNLYSDSTYYFLTPDLGPGKRVIPKASSDSVPTFFSNRFNDYMFHEVDEINLIKSGKIWFGEVFNNQKNSYDFPLSFPNIYPAAVMNIRTFVVARSTEISRFFLFNGSQKVDSLTMDETNPESYYFAKLKVKSSLISHPAADLTLHLTYSLPVSNAVGWLNYLEVNCIRQLIWVKPQMPFRDVNTSGQPKIMEFAIRQSTPEMVVWNVTNPGGIRQMMGTVTDSTFRYRMYTDTLTEFIAFDGSFFYPVKICGTVSNQNLHAMQPAEMVIVTNPLFEEEANILASFHKQTNGMTVHVARTDQIYTEFGCGQKDPTAIRDFARMLYTRGTNGNTLKYLLLFGDGSYDPKDRIPNNNNLVPAYQSTESLKSVGTYVADDYYGILGPNEGIDANGSLELGIGRLPVTTKEEAQSLVAKIMHYSEKHDTIMGDWRNVITLVADDENNNLHFDQGEELSAIVAAKYPNFNVNKIYFDAYQMIKIPGGSRFPDANKALNEAVRKGSLIINYNGHGGEAGWSYEQVLTVPDIESWKNFNKLPVFLTATCEFSRFDNPERFSAGEMVILHPNGGAISLYTTTRMAFATSNQRLDTSFFRHLMDKKNGDYITMGDLIRVSKNNNANNSNIRNFVLLGDPAQRIAFPGYQVKATSINDEALNQADTVRGLSKVTVKGYIADQTDQKVTSFNGILDSKIFDKPVPYTTIGNTSDSYPARFYVQNSLLSQGVSKVEAGEFEFSFVMPKEIALQYGKGKLSLYAHSDSTDASGYTNQIIIGGVDPNVNPENPGPEIALFMGDRNFVSGNRISRNSMLIADIADPDGINYVGLGIGHEIIAVLDDSWSKAIVLNDYYLPDTNTYASGSVGYLFYNLSPGLHRLTVKAWDMYNNSSEKEIFFTVDNSLTVKNIQNHPNPFMDKTWFYFEPVQNPGGLDVQIHIFDLAGRPVRDLGAYFPQHLTDLSRLEWDGTDFNGNRVSTGVYPYKIIFKGRDGSYSQAAQKLVVIR